LFISINNVITVVWGLIFFVNALIYLVLEQFLSVVLSNIFVVVGIAFSIIYPVKASAYQSYKEFRKFDWKIDIDPKRSKNENEYDVIIVGAGIGGLVCSALLSKWGYKVLVLEQHYQVGGFCSSFTRRGFVFNSGVEDVVGCGRMDLLPIFLISLGLEKMIFSWRILEGLYTKVG